MEFDAGLEAPQRTVTTVRGWRQRSAKMSIAYLVRSLDDVAIDSDSSTPERDDEELVQGQVRCGSNPTLRLDTQPAGLGLQLSLQMANGVAFTASLLSSSQASSSTSSPTTSQRGTRPMYTEEQKFFIMYARIIRDQSWPDIEEQFAKFFCQRSKDGLTSIYYRMRKNWGLKDILKTGPRTYAEDRCAVDQKAANFSRDFLLSIGYLQ